jgi:HSP20 family protein
MALARRRVNDRDRAGRVVQQRRGDRAEAHALEATQAACANREHLGPGRGRQQRRTRRAELHLTQYCHPRVLLLAPRHQVAEVFFQLPPGTKPAGRVGQGAHHDEGHIAERRLLEGERERGLRRRRSVHAGHHWAGSLGQPIKVEDYVEGDHYMVRAELAGIDPGKDVEVTVESGYLTIRAERSDKTEGKHRSEFRYGSFTRTLALPANANEDKVTASYHDGILTISVGLKSEEKAAAKKIEIATHK